MVALKINFMSKKKIGLLIALLLVPPGGVSAAALNIAGSMGGYSWYTPERYVESGIRIDLAPQIEAESVKARVVFSGLRYYNWSTAADNLDKITFNLTPSDISFSVNNDPLLQNNKGKLSWYIGNRLGVNYSPYTIQTDYMWTEIRLPGIKFYTNLKNSQLSGFIFWRDKQRFSPLMGAQLLIPSTFNTNMKLIYVAANSYEEKVEGEIHSPGALKERNAVYSIEVSRPLLGGNIATIVADNLRENRFGGRNAGLVDVRFQRGLTNTLTVDASYFNYDKDFDPLYRSKNFRVDEDNVRVPDNPVDLYGGKKGYRIGLRGRNTIPNIDQAYLERFQDTVTKATVQRNFFALSQMLGKYRLNFSHWAEQSLTDKNIHGVNEFSERVRTLFRVTRTIQIGNYNFDCYYERLMRDRLNAVGDLKAGRVNTQSITTTFRVPTGALRNTQVDLRCLHTLEADGSRKNKVALRIFYKTLSGTNIRIGWTNPNDPNDYARDYWQGPDIMTGANLIDNYIYIGKMITF